ncbi:aminodeoxychorismate lyase [Halomonas sp. BBD48]|nr:aminodeoxychorismate lyase [Halomonas sp. BBD48]
MADEAVPFGDRGLAYGDGLFETVLVRDGRPLLWEEHMARLQEGCRRLGIAFPGRAHLDELAVQSDPGLHVLKLLLTRGSGGRGYLPPERAAPRLRWRSVPFVPQPTRWAEGVRVRLCDLTLGSQPRLAGIKHLNRLENVLARQEWSDPEIAEGLLSDCRGHVIEATSMNLFWLCDGRWETPRLAECGVAGTLRAGLLDAFELHEVMRGHDVFFEADSLWLGNSVQGVWPIASLMDPSGTLLREWSVPSFDRSLQAEAHALLGYPAPA